MYLPLPVNLEADFDPVLSQRWSDYRPSLPITTYSHCFVTHSGIGLKHFRLISESPYQNTSARLKSHFYLYALRAYFSQPHVRLDEPNLLLLHNHWSYGYHHWVADCLVKLRDIDCRRFVAILPSDHPPFALESLRLFPLAGTVELPAGMNLKANRLTVVSNPYVSRYNPAYIRWLRNYLGTTLSTAGNPDRLLYVTRRHARCRRVENEDAVVSLLRRYGFSAVDSAQLSFSSEVRLFAECRVLVSLHGAGLTNCLFMPPDGQVLELYRTLAPGTAQMNTTYWHLASAADQRYYYQFCRPSGNEGNPSQDANVTVDLALLERNVRMMLQTNRRSTPASGTARASRR